MLSNVQLDDLLIAVEKKLGFTWFDYQVDCFRNANLQPGPQQRLCLYYRTGAGKSITALTTLRIWGYLQAVVIAPPSTHDTWLEQGKTLGINLAVMSHAKFRMKTTKLDRNVPVIADEMHQFGGHAGKGWSKLDRLARGLQAPMILASATPNYNDADRVYCIEHILSPENCKGGFLEWIYSHCMTEQNPFGMMPNVTGFLRYPDAASYLEDLPKVEYLPDDVVYSIKDYDLPAYRPSPWGYDDVKHKMIASQIERKHMIVQRTLIDNRGNSLTLQACRVVSKMLVDWERDEQLLVFANHSTVAEAAHQQFQLDGYDVGLITGKTSAKEKEFILREFRAKSLRVLIGTASLATGTDGLDKVCDTLLILDDTDDDSLRRQLIGRIMPRGADNDATMKKVLRLNLE